MLGTLGRSVLVLLLAIAGGSCAANPYRTPASLHAYEIILPGRDSLRRAFAFEFARAGLRVRREPRGGGPPAATLVYYEFAAPGAGGPRWFHARLYDVRSSLLLAAMTILVDSLPPSGRDRAQLVAERLLR